MTPNESENDHPISPEAKNYSTRRDFLLKIGLVLNTVAAFLIGIPIVGFIVSSLIRNTPPVWFSIGPVSKFPEGVMRQVVYENPYRREADGQTARLYCWVRRGQGDKFNVFAANCTHLGCPVRWFDESQLFLCPCHGGAFYADGERAAGPPPRGLYVYPHRVQNGELQINAGVLPTLANPLLNRMSAKERGFINAATNVAMWFEDRLHIVKIWKATGGHPIPRSSASWFYVFGSMTLLCFTIQVVTGIVLSLVYIPSANEAYRSLEFLNYGQELGWFMRAMHYWGSNCMVVCMFFHMTQVFLWGAYKHPRELTWISGVVLLLLTLALSFSGQVMRFDSDAYWGIGIGAAILGRIPIIGAQMVNLLLGGPIIGSDTLSRFFALHVFVLPGAVLALVSVHLRLVLLKGINEYPKPGVQVHKATYEKDYEELIHKDGMPFMPNGIGKDIVANGLLLLLIVGLALFFGPKGPDIPADPTQVISEAKPDYPFLWLLSAAALMPNGSEPILFFVMPAIAAVLMFGLPFFSNVGEKHYSRRPVAIVIVLLTYLAIAMLTYAGITGPWSPHMEAWTSAPMKPQFLKGRSPVELQGALLVQSKQCRNCHVVGEEGGHRGPDLSDVGTRMNESQLIRQVIQGGGNMPAYGNNLTPPEVKALVSFLVSLRPPGTIPAQNPAHLAQRGN